ncbi:MAG TPA: indolepyruvate ferredoxin oxidoreductase family protein, partial [Limnobacter sp.]|nr:indolepyruvate ferredoxin oxidoreductase family protein [Limnobacter sp.]
MNAPCHPLPRAASLDDKYTLPQGRIYLTGTQALVRLTLLQAELDRINGLNTGGFVSGYRGSPLGGVDQAFWAAEPLLKAANIHFQPGLNEDLAATSVWGSQQLNLFQGAQVQGVFGLWYGKGPGVDRSLDVFKHANAAGTSKHGGVLLVAGDDHAAKSSTLPHQSDHVLKAALIPVLFPSNVQEIIDFGLLGYAMSRYAGVWVGLKAVADVVESSATVEVDASRFRIQQPDDFTMPPGGLNIRWPDPPLDQEARLIDHKLYAALAFCRANHINHIAVDSPQANFGIVATGKAYQDTRQALDDLGLTAEVCSRVGIRIYKVGMVWPLDAVGIREFAKGLREILVIEEKRQLVEYQVKEELYAWREDVRPKVYGKFDERLAEDGREGGEWSLPQGQWLLPSHHELDPALIALAIARRLQHMPLPGDLRHRMEQRLNTIHQRHQQARPAHAPMERKPHFCSGCPHNTSTKVPEGSRAMAGIGCHYMAVWMDRSTETYTQMGGEGVPWIGQAKFTSTPHVFANLGDGTYFHSGVLAIRASVAAGVNITYKLLYNDAVAMTGGQKLDGHLPLPMLVRQLLAEGVARVVVVSDNPEQNRQLLKADPVARDVEVFHRRELDDVQKQMRTVAGTTVLVYEQTCASEKRRRSKRNDPVTGQPRFTSPRRRVVINPRVCEGCGDCSSHSNCLSIEPLPTPWGVKRTINQSTCNKDYSCLEGLCPSLVTVEGADLKSPQKLAVQLTGHSVDSGNHRVVDTQTANPLPQVLPNSISHALANLPPPVFLVHPDQLDRRYSILIAGVGGSGVVTLGAWLGMASHLQGLQAQGLDMAGLAQKGGAVYSHLQVAPLGQHLHSSKIPVGEADLLIAGDLLVASHEKTLELLAAQGRAVVNNQAPPTADFIRQRDWQAPAGLLHKDIQQALADPASQYHSLQATRLAEQVLGDSLYANPILLGFAWQKGYLPLHLSSLRKAIELNAVKVQENLLAFQVGRLAAHHPELLDDLSRQSSVAWPAENQVESPDEMLKRMQAELTLYQDEAYGRCFAEKVLPLRPKFEVSGQVALWEKLCRVYCQLLMLKDEYEVARLHCDAAWRDGVLAGFDPGAQLVFHFSPAWLGGEGNRPRKIRMGAAAMPLLKLLAALRGFRGSWMDPFRHSQERKNQLKLTGWFETWTELLHNEPSMLQHSKEVDRMLDLFG